MEELLTVEEVAKYLRLSESDVRRKLKAKKIKGFKIESQWRIKKIDLDEYLNSRQS